MSFSVRRNINPPIPSIPSGYWGINGRNIYNNSQTVTINNPINRGTLLTANESVYPNGYSLDICGSMIVNQIYDGTDFPGNNGQILSNVGQINPQLCWTYQGSNFRASDMFPENEVISVFNSGSNSRWKNGPGALAPNGVIFFPPYSDTNFDAVKAGFFMWNPYTNQRSWMLTGFRTDKECFSGGSITAPNGSMYFLPYGLIGNSEGFDTDASSVLVVNLFKKSGNLYDLIDNTTNLKPTLPLNINVDYLMSDLSSEGGLGWRGLAYRYIYQSGASSSTTNNPAAGNNFLYGIPYNSSIVLKINWYTNTTNLVDLSNITTINYPSIGPSVAYDISKWYGGVLANNSTGSIYCIPNNAQCVMKINPSAAGATDTITFPVGLQNINTTTYPFLSTNFNKWRGGALAPNGKIYCAPYSVNAVLVIDPSTDTISFDISGFAGSYTGAILAPNGKIYCAPTNGSNILVLNPENNTWSYIALSQTVRSFGPILTPQGQVAISILNSSNYMPVIKTGFPKYPLWMLSPELNKV